MLVCLRAQGSRRVAGRAWGLVVWPRNGRVCLIHGTPALSRRLISQLPGFCIGSSPAAPGAEMGPETGALAPWLLQLQRDCGTCSVVARTVAQRTHAPSRSPGAL